MVQEEEEEECADWTDRFFFPQLLLLCSGKGKVGELFRGKRGERTIKVGGYGKYLKGGKERRMSVGAIRISVRLFPLSFVCFLFSFFFALHFG